MASDSPVHSLRETIDSQLLLADIRQIFAQSGADRLFTRDLLARLKALPNRPWSSGTAALTKRSLAKRLLVFGICSRNMRLNGVQSKGCDLQDFTQAFAKLSAGT